MSHYPEESSDVVVTFTDGLIQTYRISAGPGIGRYLAQEAGANGVLSLYDKTSGQSWGIPMASIRDWSIRRVQVAEPVTQASPVDPTPTPTPAASTHVGRMLTVMLSGHHSDWWTPPHIAKTAELSKQFVNDSLHRMRDNGLVEKSRNRWRLTDQSRAAFANVKELKG